MNDLTKLVLKTIPAANDLAITKEKKVTYLLEQLAAKLKFKYVCNYVCIDEHDDIGMIELVTDIAPTLRLLGYRVNIENTYIEIEW